MINVEHLNENVNKSLADIREDIKRLNAENEYIKSILYQAFPSLSPEVQQSAPTNEYVWAKGSVPQGFAR